jgi:thiol-disulfide isomerase/thioredoxin
MREIGEAILMTRTTDRTLKAAGRTVSAERRRLLLAMSALGLGGIAAALFWNAAGEPNEVSTAIPANIGRPPNFLLHEAPALMPELRFSNGEGRPLSLADFRGKVVLLNIWATWCVPCRKEMPTLDRLQAALGGTRFEVVALSIDRGGADAVRRFYDETGIQRLAIRVDTSSQVGFALATVGLPTTLLIDGGGRELGRLIGPAEWDAPEMVAFLKSTVEQQGEPMAAPQNKE